MQPKHSNVWMHCAAQNRASYLMQQRHDQQIMTAFVVSQQMRWIRNCASGHFFERVIDAGKHAKVM